MYFLDYLEDDKVTLREVGFNSFEEAILELRKTLKERNYSEEALIQVIDNKENYEDKENDFHSIRTHYDDKEKYFSIETCRGHESYRIAHL